MSRMSFILFEKVCFLFVLRKSSKKRVKVMQYKSLQNLKKKAQNENESSGPWLYNED